MFEIAESRIVHLLIFVFAQEDGHLPWFSRFGTGVRVSVVFRYQIDVVKVETIKRI